MKSKLVISAVLMLGLASSLSAQEKTRYYTENPSDNIFLSVGVGIQGTVNDNTDFGKSITPLVSLSLGKYITPVWGVRAQVYGWSSKQKTDYLGPFNTKSGNKVERKENYFGGNIDGLLNLTNLFLGYQPGRVFELSAFLGPSVNAVKNYKGWNYGTKTTTTTTPTTLADGTVITVTSTTSQLDPNNATPANEKFRWLVGASAGLQAKFNVSETFAIDLEARGQITPAILGAYSSNKTDGYLHFTIGGTYTFGGKKFVPANAKVDNSALNDEINRLRSELDALRNRPAEVRTVEKTVEVEKAIFNKTPVFFQIGSYKLDKYAKAAISLAAEGIKANPGKVFKVSAYADKATGSVNFNQKLTENRAKAVYDALVAEGVSESQLQIVPNGGVENMFGTRETTRVVIMGVD